MKNLSQQRLRRLDGAIALPQKQAWFWRSAAILTLATASLQAQTVNIPATYRLEASRADTTKPGFIFDVFQNEANQENNNSITEVALAGELRDVDGNLLPNNADPSVQGAASAAGVKQGTADNALVRFLIPTVINMDQDDGGQAGSIVPNDAIPGIPGLTGSTDGIKAQWLTWLQFPAAGVYTIIVNSDDGFTFSMGGSAPADRLNVFVGEFNGGRGASDTVMRVNIPEAGLYAARGTWQEGGGGANLEFVQQLADGTKVAINGEGSTIKAYQAVTGAGPTFFSRAFPAPGLAAPFNLQYDLAIVDGTGGAVVDPASVKLYVDNVQLTAAVVSKVGATTSIRDTQSTFFPPLSNHTLRVDYVAGSVAISRSYPFSIVNYGQLDSSVAVTPVTSAAGFTWDVFQNEANQSTENDVTELTLAGELVGGDGQLLPNLADEAAVGAASGNGVKQGTALNSLIRFNIPTVINLDQEAGNNGNIQPDEQMPGIPGTSGSTDGIKAQILTFLELPAGVTTMIVNSDDGFRATAGNVTDIFDAQFLGAFNGGRGAADTTFSFVVKDAGVYPFRVIYCEGGGGANIEFLTVKADGTKVLVNDTANGGVKAYRTSQTAPKTPSITSVFPNPGSQEMPVSPNITVRISDGIATVASTPAPSLTVNGVPVTAVVSKAGAVTTVSYKPTVAFPTATMIPVQITFTDSAGAVRTESWQFNTTIFSNETLFIETEDFDFGGGQTITNAPIGMTGPYPGGNFAGLGTLADEGIDWSSSSAEGQPYRPDTLVAAGKPNANGLSRGNFVVSVNHSVGWNANNEWRNFTRTFPTPAQTYDVYGRMSSGGAPIDVELSRVTSGWGTPDQTTEPLAYWRPGRATAGWDSMEIFQATDTNGVPVKLTLGGTVTLRINQISGEHDDDFLAFVPVSTVVPDPVISITSTAGVLIVSSVPTPLPAGWVLQTSTSLTSPTWTTIPAGTPYVVPTTGGASYIRAYKP